MDSKKVAKLEKRLEQINSDIELLSQRTRTNFFDEVKTTLKEYRRFKPPSIKDFDAKTVAFKKALDVLNKDMNKAVADMKKEAKDIEKQLRDKDKEPKKEPKSKKSKKDKKSKKPSKKERKATKKVAASSRTFQRAPSPFNF